MTNKKENIDLLLERNAAEQLARVDWERLNAAISARLEVSRRTGRVATKRAVALKIAGGLAAAAAIILVVVTLRTERPKDLKLKEGRRAAVEFMERTRLAAVEMVHVRAGTQVLVDIGGGGRRPMCDVKIVDADGGRKENGTGATWIIISRPEPAYADNGVGGDMMDFLYLF
ncbi:MAG: hypothetical protein ACYTBJ_03630 [Planctomycetota bacterium]|jgi:hypothetical protein